MNTTDLVLQLAEKLSISQKEARRLLYQEMNAISGHLGAGRNVIVRNFGTLALRDARRNSKNSNSKTVFFRTSQKLKDFVRSWRPS